MAYGVHWQIDFVARNNNKFRIEILQDGYGDEIIYLRGAANPIETSEDSSDDIFTPVRKQTGSLRIEDDGFDLDGNEFDYTSLLPYDIFDNQVRLWQEGETDILRWVGYIRPDSLTSRLFEAVSLREFQIVCPLGTMYDLPLTFSNDETNAGTFKTMGQILHVALNSLGVEWEYVYKQNNVQSREDLIAKVSLLNFIGENKPTHTEPPSSDIDSFEAIWRDEKTSWGAVVEEVCKFWGWTLYSRGFDIYIVTAQQSVPFAKFAFGDLTNATTYSLTDGSDTIISLYDLSYASKDHTECRKLGYRDIEIEADVNEYEEVVNPDYQKMDFSYLPVASDPNQIIHQDNSYQYVLRRLGETSSQQSAQTGYFDNYQIYENRMLQTAGITAQYVILYYDSWKNEDYANKTEFNFKKGICCYIGRQLGGLTFFAKTLDDVCLPLWSALSIEASVVKSMNPSDSSAVVEGSVIYAALKIGDKYYDAANQAWTTSFIKFPLTARSDGSITYPTNTFTGQGFFPSGILFDSHAGTHGYTIYMSPSANNSQGICGRLKLMLYASAGSQTDYAINVVLNSLAVSIYNSDNKLNPTNKGSHKYTGVASTRFREKLSVNLSMASGQHNLYGRGQLYNPDLSLLDLVPFRISGNTYQSKAPEVRLLERMKTCYQNITMQSTIEVEDNLDATLPSVKFTQHWSSVEYFRVLYCHHKWREGTMKLTIINK